MAKGVSKETKELIKALEAQGYSVQRTRNSHWLIRNPEGKAIATMASTPSDPRSMKNAIAALRRHGFRWKGR